MSYKDYKFAYFGSPLFSKIVLERLVDEGIIPYALICNPDKKVGRKQEITPPDTKKLALENNLDIEIYQPSNKEELKEISKKFKDFDFGVVAAYSKIIPSETIEIFKDGIIGVHPSLLPKYRGASPIQSVILAGEEKTGSTIYQMDEKVDNGPIIKQEKLDEDISDITYLELEEKLANLSAKIFIEFIKDYKNKELKEQDDSKATFTEKFETENGFVDLKKDNPEEIYNKIRALNPDPGVYAIINNVRTKLLEAKKEGEDIVITKITPAGKKEREVKIVL